MENYDNIQELDLLRQQVREFKERLDRQEIISERMLRQSMRSRLSWIRNFNIWVSIAGLFFIPIIVAVFRVVLGVSWPPLVLFTLIMLGEVIYNLISVRPLRNQSLGAVDLVTAARRLRAYKRREQRQMLIEIPLLVIFVVWIAIDVARGTAPDEAIGMAWTALVGGTIGGIVGVWFFFKEMRCLNQIVHDIDEFCAE